MTDRHPDWADPLYPPVKPERYQGKPLREQIRLPESEQFQENPFLRAAIQDAARKRVDHQEQLIREHFADTPIALASVLRTGVMPWRVEVQTRQVQPEFDEDPYTLRIHEDVRVVEYPRA